MIHARDGLLLAMLMTLSGCGFDAANLPGASGTSAKDNFMEYEGQRFQTSRDYNEWDQFVDDPNNYPESETPRMAAAVRAVQFLPSAGRRDVVMKQMFEKQFPGFGCGQLGLLNRNQLDSCAAFSVEIPRTELMRYLGYAKIDGQFVLVSDFEAPRSALVSMVSVDEGDLVFHRMNKSEFRRDPIQPKK
jgi:hypothetical protein